jgi:hypothetical protein
MSPVELIKVSLQCWTTTTMTTATASDNTTQTLIRHTREWYPQLATRGLTATLLRDGIPHGVWFVAYDVCKTTLHNPETTTTSTHDDDCHSSTRVGFARVGRRGGHGGVARGISRRFDQDAHSSPNAVAVAVGFVLGHSRHGSTLDCRSAGQCAGWSVPRLGIEIGPSDTIQYDWLYRL